MNRKEADILYALLEEPYVNQRLLSEISGYSLGVVNQSIKSLRKAGYLTEQFKLTKKAQAEISKKKPQNAIILAAGFGMRMVPINTQYPKALLEVHGEPLIERIIKQLQAVNITSIYVVAGFLKEQFEYLIDEYGIEVVVNEEYSVRNNLHSLALVAEQLSNTYIVPGDIWCDHNPFRTRELYSWYMVSDLVDDESQIRVNRKKELVYASENQIGNTMIGISYLVDEQSKIARDRLIAYDKDPRYNSAFWEEILYEKGKMITQACVVPGANVVEINTYEQLRELDEESKHLKSDAMSIISQTLQVPERAITNITTLKKGMTNRSFLFAVNEKKYIMRIPGEGTDKLINRKNEASVYETIAGKNICDDILYINPSNGYKITEYLEKSRTCDPNNEEDIIKCMQKLKAFHELKFKVNHDFDLFKQINYYESLWGGSPSAYRDYQKTKAKVMSLRSYIEDHIETKCLSHIDAVPDNFLFVDNGDLRLIDWEYAGMQDPHVDLAMFCIYALYKRKQVDQLIDIYFDKACPNETRIKIYAYIAVCGLLWSNWCEYKRNLGIEFGEYSLRQYRYAKDYYKIVKEELNKNA